MVGYIRKKVVTKFAPKKLTSRNYKHYNPETVRDELGTIDWEPFTQCNDSNKCWNFLKEILISCLDKHSPYTTKTVKGKPIGSQRTLKAK